METQTKTILLVEDDMTNRKLVRVVLAGKNTVFWKPKTWNRP